MTAGPPGAVVIGGYINGLGVVRALAARGVPVAVVPTQPFDLAQFSRHARFRAPRVDPVRGAERLLELLAARAESWRGWALVPTNDEALEFLAGHGHALERGYRLMAPSPEITGYFTDKRRMMSAAREVGLALPRHHGAAEPGLRPPEVASFPVLVKPLVGFPFAERFACKLLIAHTPAELAACIERVNAAGLPCDVYDFVPGPDSEIYAYCLVVDRRGEPSAGVTVRKLRQSPPLFGVARVAEVVEDPAGLREATVELVRRIGHRGIAVAEFKRDVRDGTFRFMEVNGRSVIYNELVRRAGLDLAGVAWADFVEGRSEPVRTDLAPRRWINLHADLLYSTVYRGGERVGLREFARPYRGRWVEAVWRASDPLPFLVQWARTAREGLALVASGRQRRRLVDRSRVAVDHSAGSSPISKR